MKIEEVTKEFLYTVDVHNILPQQDPFVMIGRLCDFSLESSTTETLIKQDNVFVNDGTFSISGIMENIAQTCAARLGFYNKYILLKDCQVGFIGAINNLIVTRLPKEGETIITRVDVKEEIFGMTLAEAEVRSGGEILVASDMKLSIKQ